jgi:uncharacterized membrane protein YphA (DoxX/SURF4 family)
MDAAKARRTAGIVALWVASVLLGVGFMILGSAKFSPPWPGMFANWGYPAWFTYPVGLVEVAGGALLLIPKTALPAALGLGLVMIGATATHVVHGEGNWIFTLILLAILSGIARARYLQRRGVTGR